VVNTFDLDDCLAFITSRSAKIFAEALERRFRPYNVTRAQWIAMYYILKSESITQRELAEKMCIKGPTAVTMLHKMEADGFMLRSGNDTDKRVKHLKLTEKGMRLCTDLTPLVEEFKNDTIAGIDPEELQMMKRVLNTMVENAQKNR
jgi:DNA-binding MarR family transcriptional regulator